MLKLIVRKSSVITLFASLLLTSNISVAGLQSDANGFLTAKEIRAVLSGNSISGVWQGSKFKQNIHHDGVVVNNLAGTIYSNIPWVANERNEYCEDWSDWGWFCYKLKTVGKKKIIGVSTDGSKTEVVWRLHRGFIDLNF